MLVDSAASAGTFFPLSIWAWGGRVDKGLRTPGRHMPRRGVQRWRAAPRKGFRGPGREAPVHCEGDRVRRAEVLFRRLRFARGDQCGVRKPPGPCRPMLDWQPNV
ncbi:uncharacterized protein Tco025E_09024, partial [Trypanosoma conorhini]